MLSHDLDMRSNVSMRLQVRKEDAVQITMTTIELLLKNILYFTLSIITFGEFAILKQEN